MPQQFDFPPDIEGFTEEDAEDLLNAQYSEIDGITAENIALENEIVERYKETRKILADAQREPIGQRASMMRVATDILRELVKTKVALYNSERLIALENCLISVLQDFPDMKAEFIRRYELALETQTKDKNGR